MTQPPYSSRRRGPGALGYFFAALGVLTSLSLGIATLVLGTAPVEPDAQGPSVSIEETDPNKGDAPKEAGTPGFDPRQADLVEAEERRIYATNAQIVPGTGPHDVTIPGGAPTVVLPARPLPYDLAALITAGAVSKQPDGMLLMQKSVLVGAGAQLRLTAPSSTLRMSSGPQGFVTLVALKGSLIVEGNDGTPLSVTSWDPTKNAPDSEESDGRAYIRSIGGRMDLRAVNVTNLGFWSGKTGGVAWTGSAAEPATGSARGVGFTGNHYGVYSDRTKGLLINGAEVKNSAMDGVAIRGTSDGAELWNVNSSQNARNGIAVARGAHNVSIRNSKATGNARNGIFLNGTPPAQGPNAAGGTTLRASGFTVDGTQVTGNAEHGILITSADKAELTRNEVFANKDGIVVRGVTEGVALRENKLSSAGGFAVAIRDGAKDAVVDKNTITDAQTAVQVNNAVAKISGNEISAMTMHAVSIIGNGNGSSIVDNRWAGRGPSSIDLNRIAQGSLVDISGNDDSNWTVDRDNLQFTANFVRKHPLILLWCLILVFPLAGRIYFKRRGNPGAPGQHPYRPVAAVASMSPAARRPISASASKASSAASSAPSASSVPAKAPNTSARLPRSAARPPTGPGVPARRATSVPQPARDARSGREAAPARGAQRTRPGGKPSASRNGASGGPTEPEPPRPKQGAPLKPVSWSGPGPRQPGEATRNAGPGRPAGPGGGRPDAPGKRGDQGQRRPGQPPRSAQQPGQRDQQGKPGGPGPRQPSGQQARPPTAPGAPGTPGGPGGPAKPGAPGQQPGSGQQPGPGQGQQPGGQNQQGPNNKRPPQGGTRVTVVSPQ